MAADREVRLTRSARADLRSAVDYYNEQGSDLGRRLEEAAARSLEVLATRPESFAIVYRNVRRATLKNFPYGVYFRVRNNSVRIIAIQHLRRDPRSWQRRAGD